MEDLQGLAPALPEDAHLVTPQAPHAGAPWGYGPGWAWYRYLGEDRAEPESLHRSLEELEGFLERLPELLGVEIGPLILGGFSQGGTTSLAYALTRPEAVDGVVVLSGFLVPEEILGAGPEALGETPVFWAHGTGDPAVPFSLGERGRKGIRESGGDLEVRDYRIGHWVAREEMDDLREWITRALESA